MGYSDQQLRDAVDAVFGQFDKDNSNSLDQQEVFNLIQAALQKLGSNQQVSQQQVQQFIQAVDKSGDGKIQKQELYEIFKKVLNWFVASKCIHIQLTYGVYGITHS